MNQPIEGITGGTMKYFSADEIPDLFRRSGMTQSELAGYVGVSTNTVARWLKGKRKSSLKQVHRQKLADLRKAIMEGES